MSRTTKVTSSHWGAFKITAEDNRVVAVGYPLKAGQIGGLQHYHCSGIEVLAAQIV